MGFRGRHKNRRDTNEGVIVATLQANGVQVYPMDQPCDLLCLFRGEVHLVEVKAPKGKLTDAQEEFLNDGWPLTILRSVEDAEDWIELKLNALLRGQEKEQGAAPQHDPSKGTK
jgi:hypothetical protein